MSLSSLTRRALQLQAHVQPTEQETWPPDLALLTEAEQEQARDLIDRVTPRLAWDENGINFDQITDDELREMAELQEEILRREGQRR